jgi:uncharacterized protein (DUF433 family)
METRVPSTEALLQRITIDPEIHHGKPVIRELRYPVELILQLLSAGMTHQQILEDYDDLEEADILAALAYGARATRIHHITLLAV